MPSGVGDGGADEGKHQIKKDRHISKAVFSKKNYRITKPFALAACLPKPILAQHQLAYLQFGHF